MQNYDSQDFENRFLTQIIYGKAKGTPPRRQEETGHWGHGSCPGLHTSWDLLIAHD